VSASPRLRAIAVVLAVGILLLGAIAVLPRSTSPAQPGLSPSPPSSGDAVPSLATAAVTAEAPTQVPTPAGPPRIRALSGREVFGFLPYWKLGQPTTHLDLEQLTTIAYFGVEAHQDGHLIRVSKSGAVPQGWAGFESQAFADMLTAAHAAHVRVVLTIQRFAWTGGQARRTVKLLQDPAARSSLVGDIVAVVKDRGIDGINLDWEPVPAAVRDDFTTFVRELRAGLDGAREGLQLTFDLTTSLNSYDLPALTADDGADAALVMGYDYRVATATRAGSTAPLDTGNAGFGLRATVAEALTVVAPERVILGLPWYGRAWSTASADPHALTQDPTMFGASQTVEYGASVEQAMLTGRLYDETEATAWSVYQAVACRACPETWRQLWYDDVDGFRSKVGLAIDRGLRGIGIWALGDDGDHPELWSALRLALGTVTDSKPPIGTAKLDPSLDPAVAGKKEQGLPVVQGVARLTLAADDGTSGSGPAFVRVSNLADVAEGQLVNGRSYPSLASLDVSLTDPVIGGSTDTGKRTVYVQWRDVAGNWSNVVSVNVWNKRAPTVSPSPSPSPEPIPSVTPPPY
jgi:spore germination protein YaaH